MAGKATTAVVGSVVRAMVPVLKALAATVSWSVNRAKVPAVVRATDAANKAAVIASFPLRVCITNGPLRHGRDGGAALHALVSVGLLNALRQMAQSPVHFCENDAGIVGGEVAWSAAPTHATFL